ncbi:Arc family DNA-binding protein [Acinetobacter tandoii]|uniref:Arc family DNA-binding protein n=1 Tax=Acinetobacter tandoii TaxID=202954 RepID=UPI00301A53B2
MSDEQSSVVTLKVRVSPEFREKIVNTAKQNNRSMNQEIVARLEDSFSPNSKQPIYLPENSAKDLNTILSLSFGTIIKNLILNDVPLEVISRSFPDSQVFKEIIDMFKDLKKNEEN